MYALIDPDTLTVIGHALELPDSTELADGRTITGLPHATRLTSWEAF